MFLIMFLLFINDLAKDLKLRNVGAEIGGRRIPILIHADDIVLLSDNPSELQTMLDIVNIWCSKWLMAVNLEKKLILYILDGKMCPEVITSSSLIMKLYPILMCTKKVLVGLFINLKRVNETSQW